MRKILSELLLAQDQTADTLAEVEENLKRVERSQQQMFDKILTTLDKITQKLEGSIEKS